MRRLPAVAIPVAVASVAAVAGAGSSAADPQVGAAQREQSTLLISRSTTGGLPNGASTNPVISNDKRYARVIAFESEASNLAAGDRNGQRDVFVVFRAGSINNQGSPWRPGRTLLVSRARTGGSANGPSFAPAVGGGFKSRPRCVAFLSAASNLVRGDSNQHTDA